MKVLIAAVIIFASVASLWAQGQISEGSDMYAVSDVSIDTGTIYLNPTTTAAGADDPTFQSSESISMWEYIPLQYGQATIVGNTAYISDVNSDFSATTLEVTSTPEPSPLAIVFLSAGLIVIASKVRRQFNTK